MRTREIVRAMNNRTPVDARDEGWTCNAGRIVGKGINGWYVEGRWSDGRGERGRMEAMISDIRPHVEGGAWKEKEEAPEFKVGDIVDCDEDKEQGTSSITGARLLREGSGEWLVEGAKYNGEIAFKDRGGSYVRTEFIRQHVPKDEQEKKPTVGSREWAIEQAKAGKLIRHTDWHRDAYAHLVESGWMLGFGSNLNHAAATERDIFIGWRNDERLTGWSIYEERKQTPAVGTPEWAEEMGRQGKRVAATYWDTDRWISYVGINDWRDWRGLETRTPSHPSWGNNKWRIYEEPKQEAAKTFTEKVIELLDATMSGILIEEEEAMVKAVERTDKIIALKKAAAILKGMGK